MSEPSKDMIRTIHLLWDQLEDHLGSSKLESGEITQYPVDDGAWIGIDNKSQFHLILDLEDTNERINRRLTQDISIKTETIGIEGIDKKRVSIIAGRRWRHAIEPFAAEAVSCMANGTISLSDLKRLVEEYRSLWAPPKEPLDARKQRGVIAELKVLEHLGDHLGHAKALQCWSGNLSSKSGGLHDISDETFAIEVKSYHDEPPRVKINGLEQLDHRIDKRLTLVGLHIISHHDGMTFPQFVDRALSIYEEAGCRSTAEEKLNLAGWSEGDREEYYSRFSLGRTVICPIRPETRVFPAYLKERVPSSVSKISYLLHLNDLEALPPERPQTWSMMVSESPWPPSSDEGGSLSSLISVSCEQVHSASTDALVTMEESQNLEFKSSTWFAYQKPPDPTLTPSDITKAINQATVKTVAGFMNSEGGTLLVGVEDDNTVLGLKSDMKAIGAKDLDSYELRMTRLLSDSLGRPNIAEFVRISFVECDGLDVCRVNVRPANSPVFTNREKFYVRVSNSTNSLLPSEILQYCSNHWGY